MHVYVRIVHRNKAEKIYSFPKTAAAADEVRSYPGMIACLHERRIVPGIKRLSLIPTNCARTHMSVAQVCSIRMLQ